jgi:hypothetical protein
MTIPDIAGPALLAGAGIFSASGLLLLALTWTPELALKVAEVTWMKVAKGTAIGTAIIGGTACVVSTGVLGHDAWTAGPPPRTEGLLWADADFIQVEATLPGQEPLPPVEEELVAPAPDGSSGAVRVELVDGGDRVNWSAIRGANGELRLQVVNLGSLPDPTGWWTVCVGIPVDRLRMHAMGTGWRPHFRHRHNRLIELGYVTDRDPGDYQTYTYEFEVTDRPLGPVGLEHSLWLAVGGSGEAEHRIGLGVARGRDHEDTEPFQRHRSTLTIDCSQ